MKIYKWDIKYKDVHTVVTYLIFAWVINYITKVIFVGEAMADAGLMSMNLTNTDPNITGLIATAWGAQSVFTALSMLALFGYLIHREQRIYEQIEKMGGKKLFTRSIRSILGAKK